MRQPSWLGIALVILLLVSPLPAQSVPAAPPPLVLAHVNLVNVADGSVTRDSVVTIHDGRITAVTASARVRPPAGAPAPGAVR